MKNETVTVNTGTTTGVKRFFKQLGQIRELNILLVLIIISALISFNSQYFFTVSNIMSIIRALSTTAIMAIGMTMVIITGGIDLSVGSVLGLSALLTAMGFENGVNGIVCVLCGLAIGIVFGVFNGLMITKIKLPPFIATLGAMSIGRGILYIITEGRPWTPDVPDSFKFIGQGYIWIFPIPVVIMIVLTIIFAIIMGKTRFGRYVYATGGNEMAANLSGVKTDRVKLKVYALSGLLSAIAGIVLYSRMTSAEAGTGTGEEMNVIAATVIGGASMAGGEGSVIGAIIGAALIGVISNGIVLLGINTYAQQMITGLVIILAVGIDMVRTNKKQ